jgi:hypothetical protein
LEKRIVCEYFLSKLREVGGEVVGNLAVQFAVGISQLHELGIVHSGVLIRV